jgi:hypothetical protein
LALVNGVAEYLSGVGDAQLNYLAGQTVVLRLTPEEQVSSYVLQMPEPSVDAQPASAGRRYPSAVRQSLTPGQQDLSIAVTDALGNYRVRAGGSEGRLDRGFSVNLPAEISRMERAAAAEIVESLGSKRTRIARTQQEIELRVGLGRVGRELFPALVIAMALVLAAEQLLANRFYESAGAASRTARPRGGDKERGRGAESDRSDSFRVSASPPLPLSPSHPVSSYP